jgi:hypothetical protein
MKETVRNTIQQYLKSYYTNDFETLISLLDEEETNNYVNRFVEFAIKMDYFGETDGFLQRIGVENLNALKNMRPKEFMSKVLNLTKKEIGEDEIHKIVNAIEIKNINLEGKIATVNYTYPVSYFGEDEIMESTMILTNQEKNWKIHFKSGLDQALSSFQNEMDSYYEKKSKDKIHNLTHHVNDLEKIVLIGYKNMNGDIVFEPRFKDGGEFSDGYAYVQVMSKYGYIDKTGELVIKPQFDSAKNFSEDLAGVQLSNSDKWAFINKKGEIKIEHTFDEVSEFNEGLCAVEINEKWGFINKKGEIVIKCQYEEVSDFWSDETDVVLLDENGELQTIYINKKGEIVDEEE